MREIRGRASLAVLVVLGMFLFMGLLSFETRTWSQPPGDEGPTLVQISNEILTVKEFQDMTMQLPPVLRAALENEEGRRKALDWVVDSKLALAEALQRRVEKEPEVQARIAAAREKIILSEYFNRLAKEKIVVSEAELQEFYTKNREEFKLSEAIRVSHILVRSEREAREILQDLKEGANFSRLAQERSVDPSRRNGGQMGWLERKVMDPDFAKAASALAKSEISGIVRTKLGYHVIRVDDTRPPTYVEYATVKQRMGEEIRRQLSIPIVAMPATPTYSFNRNTQWTTANPGITAAAPFSFNTVAMHEFGHVLGLGHEDTTLAVMNSIYHPNPNSLHADDRQGVRSLYPAGGTETDIGPSLWRKTDGSSATAATPVLSPTAPVQPGQWFTMEWTQENFGTTDVGFNIGFFLLLIGDRSVPSLGAGATSSGTVTVTLPSTVKPGFYFLLACADDTNQVVEIDENNNCRASKTTIEIK